MRFNHLTVKVAPDTETPISKSLVSKSVFFRCATKFQLDRMICQLDDDAVKDSSLGAFGQGIDARSGKYLVSIAAELPFFLPCADGSPEAMFTVGESAISTSSRMSRCFLPDSQDSNPLSYFLCHQLAVRDLEKRLSISKLTPIPLHSFVTKSFECEGDTVDAMVEEHFLSWKNMFLGEINALIEAMRCSSPEKLRHLMTMSHAHIPVFWLGIEGANEKFCCEQFASDILNAAMRPLADVSKASVQTVLGTIHSSTGIARHAAALSLAHMFYHYGNLEMALVHVSIACESILFDTYARFLLSRGVSRKKLRNHEKDITYSQLLNLHLAAMVRLNELSNADEVIGVLNSARLARNNIVHGTADPKGVSAETVKGAIQSAEKLIQFLLDSAPGTA